MNSPTRFPTRRPFREASDCDRSQSSAFPCSGASVGSDEAASSSAWTGTEATLGKQPTADTSTHRYVPLFPSPGVGELCDRAVGLTGFPQRLFRNSGFSGAIPLHLCRNCIAVLDRPDIVISAGPPHVPGCDAGGVLSFEEVNMPGLRFLSATALVVPFLAASLPAEPVKARDVRALRAAR